MGYVGLPLAVEFGKTRKVIGFDINEKRINELRSGIDRTHECSKEQLDLAIELEYSSNINDLRQSEIFIVTVPTPVDEANRPDLTPLIKASECVGTVLKNGDIVIFESTVYPGATEEVCVPVMERISGLKFNVDFYCGYSPERINPGDKINTLTSIKKITSGSNPSIADEVDALYISIISAGTLKVSSIKVAEASKVIENAQRDINIAFVNELSIIFDRIGIDTVEVLEAAGTKWNFMPFRPGMVGGHCIGIDPYYLSFKAAAHGYHSEVISAGRRINEYLPVYAAQAIVKRMLQNEIDVSRSKVGIFGVTFKENCPDIRNSKVFDLINELQAWGVSVVITDPWANENEVFSEYGLRLGTIDTDSQLDSLIIAVAHKEFLASNPEELRSFCSTNSRPIIADLKSIYNQKALNDAGFTIYRL